MKLHAEVGIVGAGPAGARAGELLASMGVGVVMLDPRAPWEKPCGGGLTAPAFEEIPELEELKPVARRITSVRVEASPEEGFTVPLDRPMWVLSRRALARWQLDRARHVGAEHLSVKVRRARHAYGGWLLDTSGGEILVRFLVGADGAASLVRRAAAPKFYVELAPTRVAYPEGSGPTPDTALLRFYRGIAGYLWDFARPGHRSVGIGVPNGTWRRPRLDGEIDEYRLSSVQCGCTGVERAGAVIGTAQLGHGDYSRIAGPDFALLGDAAGFADPLTGEGIQNAMRSAALLAQAWGSRPGGGADRYPKLAGRAFEREFQAARLIRRSLFETAAGLWLIERAAASRRWYGLIDAMVNALNEHDARITGLMGRWARRYRSRRAARSMHEEARRTASRTCGCSAGDGAVGATGACHGEEVSP